MLQTGKFCHRRRIWKRWEKVTFTFDFQFSGLKGYISKYLISAKILLFWISKFRVLPDTCISFYVHFLRFSVTRRTSSHRRAPPPPQARPGKPKPAPKPRLPMCKAIYAYDPQEADELAFTEGEMIEIVKEGIFVHLFTYFSFIKHPRRWGTLSRRTLCSYKSDLKYSQPQLLRFLASVDSNFVMHFLKIDLTLMQSLLLHFVQFLWLL